MNCIRESISAEGATIPASNFLRKAVSLSPVAIGIAGRRQPKHLRHFARVVSPADLVNPINVVPIDLIGVAPIARANLTAVERVQ